MIGKRLKFIFDFAENNVYIKRKGFFVSFGTGTAVTRPTEDICDYSPHRKPLFPQDKECYDSFCIARRKLVCIFEEAHREPAECGVYFQSGSLYLSLNQSKCNPSSNL